MTTQRPFRFGLLANQARSAAEWADKARRAEVLGYATLLLPDYLGPGLAPLPALAAAASSTQTIRLPERTNAACRFPHKRRLKNL